MSGVEEGTGKRNTGNFAFDHETTINLDMTFINPAGGKYEVEYSFQTNLAMMIFPCFTTWMSLSLSDQAKEYRSSLIWTTSLKSL